MKSIKALSTKYALQRNRLRLSLLLALLCLLCSPWLALLWVSVQGRSQQAQANVEADAFFAQFPAALQGNSIQPNDSAQKLDRIGATLGFSPNAQYLEPVVIDQIAVADFKRIDAVLTRFLQEQTALISGPLQPLPADLAAYLGTYQDRINGAQQQILDGDRPHWQMDLASMFDPSYPSPGLFNVLYLQKLILLSAIDYQHQGQTESMLSAMEASWKLNQAIAQRPDLVSQLLSSIVLAQQASLLRHLEGIPAHQQPHWQARLASHSPQQAILTGLQFESWLKYKTLQSSWVARNGIYSSTFKLRTLRATSTTQTALDWLATTDVCSLSQVAVERTLEKLQVDRGGPEAAFSSAAIARRWKSAGDRALALELSWHVLAVKQRRLEQGTWPAQLPNLTSQTCPEERWVYKRTEDTITLSLSKQLVTGTVIPLKYRVRYRAK